MSTTSTAGSSRIGTTVQNRQLLLGAAAGAVAATLVNAALWAGGRAGDARCPGGRRPWPGSPTPPHSSGSRSGSPKRTATSAAP